MFHINGTHLGKLYQMGRSCIHVSSAVNQKGSSFFRRQKRSQRRALHALDSSYDQLSSHQYGACASRAYEGICLTVFHHFHSYHNGRILLGSDCLHRRFRHLDNLGSIHHFNPGSIILIFLQLCAHCFFPAYQKYFDVISAVYGVYRALYNLQRRIISTHGVHCYSDQLLHPYSSLLSIS